MLDNLQLKQFRVELTATGIVHLVFDMPDRSMNVFSNAAIHDLAGFAAWAKQSDIKGIVVSSGKKSAFCAGADLGELGQAYGMIMASAPAHRFQQAFDHFFKLSEAVRALETCGKPVAVAVAGLALGGGCELALGAHYRVVADVPEAAFGLPESLVGLLPGSGGTQRLPRVVGLPRALPILLEGKRFLAKEALAVGLVHEIVAPGEEIAAAERWVTSTTSWGQDWDQPEWRPAGLDELSSIIASRRHEIIAETLGHYPAPLAILDCLEQGFAQNIDSAIRTEMEIFAWLIQRPEPRDMISTLFASKTIFDRRVKTGTLPEAVERIAGALALLWQETSADEAAALVAGGFRIAGHALPEPDSDTDRLGYWFDRAPDDKRKRIVREVLEKVQAMAAGYSGELGGGLAGLADYAAVTRFGFPAYLGGPFALHTNRQTLALAG